MAHPKPKPERLPWSRLFFLLLIGGLLMTLGSLVRPHDARALAELGEMALHSRTLLSDEQVVANTADSMHWTNWVEFFGFAIAALAVVAAAAKTAVGKKT